METQRRVLVANGEIRGIAMLVGKGKLLVNGVEPYTCTHFGFTVPRGGGPAILSISCALIEGAEPEFPLLSLRSQAMLVEMETGSLSLRANSCRIESSTVSVHHGNADVNVVYELISDDYEVVSGSERTKVNACNR